MGLFGPLFGDTSSGSSSSPSYPIITQATTTAAIRDRIYTAIEALTPRLLSGDRFRRSRNEGQANFISECESRIGGAYRRFQVRELDGSEQPEVSNTDYERRVVGFRVLVAYPQNARTGPDQAMDRDDTADDDFFLINNVIGIDGKSNFTYATAPIAIPDATPLGAVKEARLEGANCDYLVIGMRFLYIRNVQ